MLTLGVSVLKTLVRVIALAGLASLAAAQAPVEGNCPVFPADNIWNARVDQLPVDPSSPAWVSTIGVSSPLHPDFGSGTYNGEPIGIPYVTVPGSQTKYPATFTYQSESDPGPYAIPLTAPIEGGSTSTGDRHVIAVDTDNCILYEIYDAFPQEDSWQGGSGAIFNLFSDALRPAGWTSADAAGLAIFPGLVRYEEIVSGVIQHAIRFTVPQTQNTYVWPARHEASSLTGAQYPPMGARFRLKSSFDISTFSATNQIILTALQRYGMMLADNGSSWYISGAPDSRWDNNDLHALTTISGSNFEAVDVSTLMVDPNSGATVSSGAGPTAVSVTPSGESGLSQTFTLQYSDTAGAGSLQRIGVWFDNSTTNSAGSCVAYYTPANNEVNLFNDASTATVTATPGSATTLRNRQCSLNMADTTVTQSGNDMTLTLAVTFEAGYTRAKNIYMQANDVSGTTSGWLQMGTWSVSGAGGTPAMVSVTPNSGSGLSQTFTLQYSDTAGAGSLQRIGVWFDNSTTNSAGACVLYYTPSNNEVNLFNDASTATVQATPGTATTLQNSQCSVNVAETAVTTSGNNLTLTLAVTFKAGYTRAKNIYMQANDVSGTTSGWLQMGTWSASGAGGTPAIVSVTPNSGSGTTQTFTLQYSDTAGAANLQRIGVWFDHSTTNSAGACVLYYTPANNEVNLFNDGSTATVQATPGSATTLQNSQCSINVGASSVTTSGNTVTLTVAITFQSSYTRAKNIYAEANDISGASTGWQQSGTWTE